MLDGARWASQQWGGVKLGDKRRTQVAVEMGKRMVGKPDASLPKQMEGWAGLKSAYLLLNNEEVTMSALLDPHWQQTLAQAREEAVVLWVEDTTELDYTAHPSKRGMGPIGDGNGRGLLLHSTLGVIPAGKQVLGVGHAEVVLRQEKPAKRPKWTQTPEGQVWQVSARAIGSPPAGSRWVHVSDRGSDTYEYLLLCRQAGKDFLIRAFRNRRLQEPAVSAAGEEIEKLLDYARQLPPYPGSDYEVAVAATKKHPARTAQLVLTWGEITVAPPVQAPAPIKQEGPLHCWVVRAWEPAPPEGAEQVEWVLLTSVPVTTLTEAQQHVEWYTCRWLCEDFHQCLKTGCRIEHSQLDDGADIQRLLGFAIPIAARLLQLRQLARTGPDTPATSMVDPLYVRLLAKRLKKDATTMTIADFWRGVAQLGGHLGRRRDGPPGWRTLWRGWRQLTDWADGFHLLADSP